MAQKHLVLFDFDGTLTRKDTLFAFIRYYHGTVRFVLGFAWLSPVMALYMAKLIRNDRAKEIVLKHFFGNVPVATLKAKGIATFGISASVSQTGMMVYAPDYVGMGTLDVFDAKLLGTVSVAAHRGRWHFASSFGASTGTQRLSRKWRRRLSPSSPAWMRPLRTSLPATWSARQHDPQGHPDRRQRPPAV